MPSRIEDYALIGDCHSAALVGRDGSIDWLCWPRFDSPACFAALLGTPDNGCWKIAPADADVTTTRSYRDGSMVLETRFQTAAGRVALIDFMPLREGAADLVRLVVGEEGAVPMTMSMTLRFDYGLSVPWVSRLKDGTLRAIAGPALVALRTPAPLCGAGLSTVSEFVVRAGERVPFVLSYGASHEAAPRPIDGFAALATTQKAWEGWSGRLLLDGPYQRQVHRSLLCLKALIYYPTGGIVAAPTTSLPEEPHGVRNWDYRYCWLRDATLALLALMNAGYQEEAAAWGAWLHRAIAGTAEQMQVIYGIGGERRLDEWTLPWLAGYEGAQPVRVGNAAVTQLQLDVFGEIMDAVHHARRGGLPAEEDAWPLQKTLLERLETVWREPDEGIWEIRGDRQHFVYSKVMVWVAFDRAVRDIEDFGLDGPLEHWRELRDTVHAEVCAKGFDTELNSFVQSYGSKFLDASLLQIPLVGFLPVEDPRVAGTIAAIERELVAGGLVRRYRTEETHDGLPPGEGLFLACSFWLADNWILQGRIDEARRLFERLLGMANDVGLLSEQYAADTGRALGNFPQAFSHLALITTALNLELAEHGERPTAQAPHRIRTRRSHHRVDAATATGATRGHG